MTASPFASIARALARYGDEQRDLIEADPEFRRWLETSYVPVAGAWHF
jgi:hypothetical protein